MNSLLNSSIAWGVRRRARPWSVSGCLLGAVLIGALWPAAPAARAQTSTLVYGSDTADVGHISPLPRLGPPVAFSSQGPTEAHYDSTGDEIYLGSVGAADGNEDPNFSYGSAYDPDAVDISQGFVTRATISSHDADGFAFVVHNPANTTDSLRDPLDGAYQLPSSLSVQFVNPQVLNGNYSANHNNTTFRIFVAAVDAQGHNHVLGQLDSTTLSDDDQVLQIRYLAKFQTVDVYADLSGGGTKLLIRVPNVDLSGYGITQSDPNPLNGTAALAALGWTSAASRFGSLPAWLQRWSIGNSLVFGSGFGPNYYEDRFPFQTIGQNVWNGQGKDAYDMRASAEVKPPDQSGSKSTSNSVFSLTAGAYAKGIDVGIGADLIATGGEATISYPLFLDMALPAQYSADPGQSFSIPISFYPDPAASITTTSPTANVTADLTFGLDVGVNLDASVLGNSITSGNLVDINIPTKRQVKFFDLQEILASGLIPSVNGGVNYAGSFQGDDSDPSSDTSTHGSTEGADDGGSLASLVSFGVTIPDLSTSAQVDPTGIGSVNLASSADQPFVSLSSDFTNAVLGEIPILDLLTELPFFNNDYSLNLGGTTVELGFHLADLYGSVDLGTHVDYNFTPNPQVWLHLSDPDDTSKTALLGPYPLDPTTHTVKNPPTVNLPANGDPLTITPEVTLDGPTSGGTNMPNSFTTKGQLKIGGSLDFNPFEFSYQFGDSSFNSSSALGLPFPYSLTGSTPVGTLTKTFEIGTQSADSGGNADAVPFQKSLFGKPFTLFPTASDNPVLDSVVSDSALLQPAGISGTLPITLNCEHAYLNGEVIWDYDGVATDPQPNVLSYSRQSMSLVTSAIPLSLLTAPSTHTVTLLNMDGSGNLYPSNSVTFTVNAPVPTLSGISTEATNGSIYKPIAGGGGFQMDVQGSGFLPPHAGSDGAMDYAGSLVQWNGQSLTTVYRDAQHLIATVPANLVTTTATAQITVVTAGPGGGQSKARTLTPMNPNPVLNSLSQSQSIPGASSLTLDLIGANFVSGSVVVWDAGSGNVIKTPVYVSPGHLTLSLNASDLSTPGVRTLRVHNPTPGGGTSTPQNFTVGQYPAGGGVVFVPSLTRQSDGLHLTLTMTNTSQTVNADGTVVLSVTIQAAGGTQISPIRPSPLRAVPAGTIPAGQSVTLKDPEDTAHNMEYVFPSTLGVKGQAVLLTISGSSADKQFTSHLRVTLP